MKRSERYLVTIFDAALRGLVGIGGVVTRATAAVGATARTTVVGASVAARVAALGVTRVSGAA